VGALGVDEACALARALLLGLKAAHDAGVLHRDFKSDNVMLRGSDEKFRPLILDFGLARTFEQPTEHMSSRQHGVVGTFAYLAPEQLEGEPHSIASDIYSFGVVWFEMLTGELPFKSRPSPALTTLDRLTRPVAAPSSKNPTISEELDSIVLGCLRRSPGERFRTVDQVLAKLAAMQSARRRRTLGPPALATGLLAGLAATLIACTAYFTLGSVRSVTPISIKKSFAAVLTRQTAALAATLRTAAYDAPAAPSPGAQARASAAEPRPAALSTRAALKRSGSTQLHPGSSAAPPAAVSSPPPASPRDGWEHPF